MIREIGSIFPLSETYRSQEKAPAGEPGEILYSLCREALYDLAVHCACSGKKVLIPAYTCQTVITPFQEAGGICHFYGIRRDLRINTEHLEELVQRVEPALVVVHPYADTGEPAGHRPVQSAALLYTPAGQYVQAEVRGDDSR